MLPVISFRGVPVGELDGDHGEALLVDDVLPAIQSVKTLLCTFGNLSTSTGAFKKLRWMPPQVAKFPVLCYIKHKHIQECFCMKQPQSQLNQLQFDTSDLLYSRFCQLVEGVVWVGVGGRHPGVLTRADRQRAQAPLPLDALQPEVTTY